MRKRSGQVHSRESSATLQLTVSLLYRVPVCSVLFSLFCVIMLYRFFLVAAVSLRTYEKLVIYGTETLKLTKEKE